MELNIDAAQEALANPPREVVDTMHKAGREAQEAVASLAPSTSALAGSVINGSGSHGQDATDTSRLQVVDEVREDGSKLWMGIPPKLTFMVCIH